MKHPNFYTATSTQATSGPSPGWVRCSSPPCAEGIFLKPIYKAPASAGLHHGAGWIRILGENPGTCKSKLARFSFSQGKGYSGRSITFSPDLPKARVQAKARRERQGALRVPLSGPLQGRESPRPGAQACRDPGVSGSPVCSPLCLVTCLLRGSYLGRACDLAAGPPAGLQAGPERHSALVCGLGHVHLS